RKWSTGATNSRNPKRRGIVLAADERNQGDRNLLRRDYRGALCSGPCERYVAAAYRADGAAVDRRSARVSRQPPGAVDRVAILPLLAVRRGTDLVVSAEHRTVGARHIHPSGGRHDGGDGLRGDRGNCGGGARRKADVGDGCGWCVCAGCCAAVGGVSRQYAAGDCEAITTIILPDWLYLATTKAPLSYGRAS